VQNVDEYVIDEGVAKGNTIPKGDKASVLQQKKRMAFESRADHVSSDEDELC
jgi:hypothetical protein